MRRLQALVAHRTVDGLSPSTCSACIASVVELCSQGWASSSWVITRSVSTSVASHDDQASSRFAGQRQFGGSKQRRPPGGDRHDGASVGQRGRGDGGDSGPRQRPQQQGQQRRGPLGEREAAGGGPQQPRAGPWGRDGGPSGAARSRGAERNGLPPAGISSGRGGGPQAVLQPQPQAQPQAQAQPERWDLVASNTPQRVFELIGDPRSGIADDTTTSPFGEVTVDMIHHQISNEVYWYKYEFAGGQLRGSHRDARLSDYTRNLIYLLRAKDPKRWTIAALADRFRIRKQRVLAVLALKELESQRIESGRLLGGPMAGYAVGVSTDDIHLAADSGAPLDLAHLPGPLPPGSPAAAALAAAAELHVSKVLPKVVSTTQQLQSQLLEALRAHRFDPERLRSGLLAELAAAEELAAQVLGGGGDGGGGGLEYIRAELDAYRAAVEAVAAAVGQVVASSPLLEEEREAAALQDAVQSALAAAGAAPGSAIAKEIGALPLAAAPPATEAASAASVSASADAGGQSAALSAPLAALREQLAAAVAPVMQAADDSALQRSFFTLPPPTRGLLLRLLPDLAIRLNAAGVDLARAARDAAYRGSAAAAAAAAGGDDDEAAPAPAASRLEVDVFGFQPVSEQQLDAVAAAVAALGGAQAALVAKLEALDPTLAAKQPLEQPAAALSAEHLRAVRSLVRNYLATEAMWGDIKATGSQGPGASTKEPAALRRALEIMHEADPGAVQRALQIEAVMVNRLQRNFATADTITKGAAEQAAKEAAAAAADAATAAAQPPQPPARDSAKWDALAAYLDVKVAGRVYATGSGERHVTRLPTYPAFEGYSLEEFDRAREGELSALNRQLADKVDAQMYERFRNDLLYNLGVRGEKLRDTGPGRPAWEPNLRTELTRPVVVYGIGADSATQCPPLYVATGDGKRRPLNEQEQVFQECRLPRPSLPYYIGRARRKPELE